MGDETTDGRFLGCVHGRYVTTVSKVRELLGSQPLLHPRPLGNGTHERPNLDVRASGDSEGNMFRNIKSDKNAPVTKYTMEEFARECVRVFCELTGYGRARVGTSPTPYR